MKLILTRHGRTLENEEHIIQGQTHGTLSEEGKLQAQKLAERLRDKKIDCIYSSDLKRAAETAKEIASLHPGVKLEQALELRERDYGAFTGKKKHEVSVDFNKDHPQLEHVTSMRARAKKILDRAYAEHPNGTVVFVGHNHINRALISVIMNIPEEKVWEELKPQKNTAVNIFEIREDKNHVVHLLNDTKHLD